MRTLRIPPPIWLSMLLVACGSTETSDFSASDEPSRDSGDNAAPGGRPGEGAPPGEEVEVESLYEAPVATGHSIWVANPQSGRVALIDAETLSISTVDAGNGPTHLAPVPGRDEEAVIVINTLSDDATLIERRGADVALTTFPIAAQANRWSIAASGRFAVAWADARLWPEAPETFGFQELTVLDLQKAANDPSRATVLAVGYRPLTVGFNRDESQAYAVTQDGVVSIDLSGGRPTLASNVPLGDDPLAQEPLTRDVIVTPAGDYALVRRDGQPMVDVLRLSDGARSTVTLPAAVSDLDLHDNGSVALAVLRQSAQVALLPVPAIFDDPEGFTTIDVPDRTFGQAVLAPATNVALLFTNASDTQEHKALTLLPLDEPAGLRSVRLYAPLLGVFPAPSGRDAVVLHRGGSDGGGAFSLVRLTDPLPARIAATEAPPFSVAVTDEFAIVTERDDARGSFGAQVANFDTLAVQRFSLASPPIAAGVVGDLRRAYVSQAHPDGRITFFDLDTNVTRTLTGFELGARVVNGSGGTQ